MKLIIVPGNSPNHKEWAEKAKEEIGSLFDATQILYYSHWETENPILDFDLELEKLVQLTEGLDDYIIFAKSAGTILTMRGVQEGKLHPQKCLFLGIPIVWANEKGFPVKDWIENFSTATRIIQQEFDRTCSVQDLEKALEDYHISNYTLRVVPGSDHDYSDWELLLDEISALL